MKNIDILAFDTEGNPPGNFEDRIRHLIGSNSYEYFKFNYKQKLNSFFTLFRLVNTAHPKLLVMEGTGSLGGLVCILSRLFLNVPFVFSSGDAVEPFLSHRFPLLKPIFYCYEKLLYSLSKGFIGWTPYLCGRALTMGARRTIVAAGWAPFPLQTENRLAYRKKIREQLGISDDALVIGIVGSMIWNPNVNYCYGFEIVSAISKMENKNVVALIVGGGTGYQKAIEAAGDKLNKTIFLVGPVPRDLVPQYLSAMDLGSLPQSVDGVGSFRYTTKISEYVSCELPIVTGQIPLAYDFGEDTLWRLPGNAPWDKVYINSLVELLTSVSPQEIERKRKNTPRLAHLFDKNEQVLRVESFFKDLLRQ